MHSSFQQLFSSGFDSLQDVELMNTLLHYLSFLNTGNGTRRIIDILICSFLDTIVVLAVELLMMTMTVFLHQNSYYPFEKEVTSSVV